MYYLYCIHVTRKPLRNVKGTVRMKFLLLFIPYQNIMYLWNEMERRSKSFVSQLRKYPQIYMRIQPVRFQMSRLNGVSNKRITLGRDSQGKEEYITCKLQLCHSENGTYLEGVRLSLRNYVTMMSRSMPSQISSMNPE